MKKVWYVILDWSGTVLNDAKRTAACGNSVLKKLGAIEQYISFEEFQEKFKLPPLLFYRQFTDAPEEDIESLFLEVLNNYQAQCPAPQLFSGAVQALQQLHQAQTQLFINSSHPEGKLLGELETYAIRDLFTGVQGSVKDKVQGLQKIIQDYALNPCKALYVGDMIEDIKAGHKVGMQTLAVSQGYHSETRLRAVNPSLGVIKSLAEIVPLVISC